MKQARARVEQDARFESRHIAQGFYGRMTLYLRSHLLLADQPLDRRTAPRVVDSSRAGAAGKWRGAIGCE
jgi:hypothetical protein